jgi:hypothetical protein
LKAIDSCGSGIDLVCCGGRVFGAGVFFLDEGGLSREGVEENQASVFVLPVIWAAFFVADHGCL